jgi:hypothetical protein
MKVCEKTVKETGTIIWETRVILKYDERKSLCFKQVIFSIYIVKSRLLLWAEIGEGKKCM